MAELPCPNCGSDLIFLDQYQRHYCYHCGRYAPEGYGARGAMRCPTCGGILSYVAQYDRLYCYRCNAYAPTETAAVPGAESTPAAEVPAKPEPVVGPKPGTPVVASPAPGSVSEAAAPASVSQPTPTESQPRPEPVSTPPSAAALVSAAATPEPAAAKSAEAEEKPAESPYASLKPAVLRVKIFTLKKPDLTDLCKVYGIDAAGTKDQLQDRLLTYLGDLGAEEWTARAPQERPEPAASRVHEESTSTPGAVQVIEEIREPTPKGVLREEPSVSAAPIVIAVPETPIEEAGPKVEHPCPTCGRELSYISQYGRWYCYFCQKYAPSAISKNACPTCGNTLRWIDQYQRWWCDVCRKYAPADLPKPVKAAVAERVSRPSARVVAATSEGAVPTVAVAHRHRNPSSGIGLIAFGVILYAVYEVLAVFPFALGYAPPVTVTADQAALLSFFGFLFVAGGALIGLLALRHRE